MSEELKDVTTRGALVAVAVALLAIALLVGIAVFRSNTISNQSPDKDRFQAVFLTNGQVYFGKLKNTGGAYLTLDDVYYIQANPQQAGQQPSASPQPNLTLVKLGDEIHGPERRMEIASSQVVFWEDLKNDSKVVDAIKKQNEEKK